MIRAARETFMELNDLRTTFESIKNKVSQLGRFL